MLKLSSSLGDEGWRSRDRFAGQITGSRKVQSISSQCQGLVQGNGYQRFRGMSRGQLGWVVQRFWKCCFKEDQIPKQLTTADPPAISSIMARLHFGNTTLHLLPFNATLHFVSGKVHKQYSNHIHTIHQIPSMSSKVHYHPCSKSNHQELPNTR